ncbi:ABC transporter permease subunit [Cytobacillus sp. FJAT-54145]|uniref:ABC transporter permease subunit n=1 Tax=Cytobacillus spartinae TaxID=3299023 RepID=A0ABW6KGB1_9BACI
MIALFGKMLRSFIILLLASIVITYAILIATDADFYAIKSDEIEVLKGVYQYYKEIYIEGAENRYSFPVWEHVESYFLRSLKLVIPAFLISMVGGVILGIFSFIYREKRIGRVWKVKEMLFGTIPDFFLFIAIQFGLILLMRMGFPKLDLYGHENWFNVVFPLTILTIAPTLYISNITFHSLLEDVKKDFVRTAAGKGTSDTKIIFTHLLWNSWGTVLSYSQTVMLFILTSLPVIEKLGFYKGAGNELIMSIKAGDTNLVIGFLLPFLLLMLTSIWLTDIVKFFLVPVDIENELESRTIARANQFRLLKGIFYFIKEFPYKHAYHLTVKWFRLYPALMIGSFLLGGLLFTAFIGPFLLEDTKLDSPKFIWIDGKPLFPPLAPGEYYLFGSDRAGRPMLNLLVLGAKETLTEVLVITLIRFCISIPLGYFASVHRGANGFLGLSNSVLSFLPTIILVILVGSIPSIQESHIRHGVLIVLIALLEVGRISEVFRQEFIKINKNDYINAAISAGSNGFQLVRHYYIPNLYQKVIFIFISDLGRVMFLLGGLGIMQVFLSQIFVLNPDTGSTYTVNLSFSWGTLLADAMLDIRDAPWISFFPAGCIALSILTFNLIGYGLKDFLEKRAHKKRFSESYNKGESSTSMISQNQPKALEVK